MARSLRHFRQRILGKRPLQRDGDTLLRHIDVADIGEVCAQMRHLPSLASGIDDEKEMVAEIGHHEIVDDPASFRCEYWRPWGSARISAGTSRSNACAASSTRPDRGRSIAVICIDSKDVQ